LILNPKTLFRPPIAVEFPFIQDVEKVKSPGIIERYEMWTVLDGTRIPVHRHRDESPSP